MEQEQTQTLTQKEITDKIFKERDTYQQASSEQRTVINDIYLAYIGQIADTTPEDKSRSKENTNKLRTEVSYIVPSIFSGQPEMEVEGVGEEDKDIAKIYEKIINYRFDTIPQFYEKIEGWVKQSCVFGTSLLKVLWRFETKDNGDGTATPITDEPDIEVPNILDCFYNPIISGVNGQNSIIFRSVLSVDDVKNNPIYDYTDEMGKLNREKIESKGKTSTDQYNSSNQIGSDKIDIKSASEGTIEVYERISNDRIQTVVDGKERLLLRDRANDYGMINAVKLLHEPNAIPNRFDGFGVGHNTLGIGKLINKLKNKMIDNVSLTNNIFTFFAKGTKIDKRQLVVKPGGGCEVDTQGKPISEVVQFAQFPDILPGAVQLQNTLEDDHKRASGANDLLQGSASNKTLGQDEIASTYSSNRFELINRRFKHALADVAEMILKMELQNLQSPDAAILRIFPEELRMQIFQLLINERENVKYNIKVKGSTNVAKNKDMQIKQITEAYGMFGAILPPENQMEWARKILELRGIDEIDKLVPDPQQYAQQMQMQAQQEMMMPPQEQPI